MSDPVRDGSLGTEEASRFQCDLYRYWRAVRQLGALRLGAHRYLTRAAVRQLRARLDPSGEADIRQADTSELADARLFFVRRLLERLGLLRRDPERGLVSGPGSEVERFFALPLDERLRLIVKLWLAGGWWVEHPDERQEPPGLRAPAHPSVAVGRRQALQALLECPADDLVLLDHLIVGGQAPSSASTHGRRRAAPPGPADSVTSALLGPLCWIGLGVRQVRIPTASSAPALRVTCALDALRSSTPAQAAQTLEECAGQVVVGADFEVLAYPPLAARTLLALDLCGDPVGSGPVARYRLSRASLVRARQAGWPTGETCRRLMTLARALPQNVEATLRDWERQADRIRLRTDLAILRVRIPRLLDALMADSTAGRAIVRRLGPTVALIYDEQAGAVRQWLIRRGEFPAMAPPTAE